MSTRQAIADALSSIDGVNGVPAPPDVLAPGSAWPTWISAGLGTGCALTDTWHVFIVLPNPSMIATVEAGDALVQQAWAALMDLGEVSVVDAATLTQADPAGAGQTLPGLRYTLTTLGDRST